MPLDVNVISFNVYTRLTVRPTSWIFYIQVASGVIAFPKLLRPDTDSSSRLDSQLPKCQVRAWRTGKMAG